MREGTPPPARKDSRWHHPDFRKLWLGQTISGFGSAITGLALPLTAVSILGATPGQMGLLGAAGSLPAILFGLLVGVWVDRVQRRPLLIVSEVGRGLLLASIPLLAVLDLLHMPYLYVVAFGLGTLSLVFDIAITAFLPSLLSREQLVAGNSRLQVSGSLASIAGPGLAGLLVQLITAPIAIVLDAVSYLISAVSLLFIRSVDAPRASSRGNRRLGHELAEGIGFVLREPSIRVMTIGSALGSLALSIRGVVYILFLTRELRVTPVWIGIIFGSVGVASLLGAIAAHPVARQIGPGPAVIVGTLLGLVGMALIPLAPAAPRLAIPFLITAQVLEGIGGPVYSISQVSLRQALTPDRLLGRVNATRRFVVFGIGPIGALTGGLLGQWLGLRGSLGVASAVMGLSFLWVMLSPLRTMREQPQL
ncbi:MAG TPA: MFS transporter [Herpetosiphonaceae bacterium]|nr:MFS transporter [Herpetosiphonaceae bacterium]